MKQYSKVQSHVIVLHAHEIAKKRGENQSDICELIDIDAGYFSKCKSGKKFLSQEKLNLLIEEYGKPSHLQTGIFKQSEYYLSTNDFLQKFRTSHELYLANQQLSYWKSKPFQENITKLLSLKDAPFERGEKKYQLLTERLQHLLAVEEFREWFDLYDPNYASNTLLSLLGQEPSNPNTLSLQTILDYFSITTNQSEQVKIECFFQRLGMMHYLFETIDSFKFENTEIEALPINEEFVLQGHCIHQEEGRVKDSLGERTYKFVSDNPATRFKLIDNSTEFMMKNCDSVHRLSRYKIEIFMTENLNFYTCLRLSYHQSSLRRNILISLDSTNVISNLQAIFKAIGSEEILDTLALKKALAEEGATIPGVTLLD